jgi:hypothetical protein
MESTEIEDPRVREAMDYYLMNLQGTVPKNTVRAYLPKQNEWKVRKLPYDLEPHADAVDSCPLKASNLIGLKQYGTRSLAVRLLMITLKIMTLGLKG